MLLGPVERVVTNPYTQQKMSGTEYESLVHSKKLPAGIYPYLAPGLGEAAAHQLVAELNDQSHEEQQEIRKILVKIFSDILSDEPSVIFQIKTLFHKSPEYQFYCVSFLQEESVLNKDKKLKIFNALVSAGAPFFIWHHQSLPELSRLLDIYGTHLANVPFPNGANSLTQCFMQPPLTIAIAKFKLLLRHGANLNHKHPKFGTLFHMFTANEYHTLVIQLLKISVQGYKALNLNLRDFEGKTLLLIACKTWQYKIVRELLELRRQGLNVDIDAADSEGRTPIMISAALGDWHSFKLLLDEGANLYAKNNQGKNVAWYLNTNEEICSILRSIHIEPQRHPLKRRNWLFTNDQYSLPLMCSKSKETHQRVLISNLPQHKALIMEVLQFTKQHNPSLYHFILDQVGKILSMPPLSMEMVCLAGKKEIREILNVRLREHCALGNLFEVMKYHYLGADPNAIDEHQRNALHYCVMRESIVKSIQKKNPAYQHRTIKSCMDSHITCFDYLMDQNVDLFQKNDKGNTIEDILRRDRIPHQAATILDTQTAQTLWNIYRNRLLAPNKYPAVLHGDSDVTFSQLSTLQNFLSSQNLTFSRHEDFSFPIGKMMLYDIRKSAAKTSPPHRESEEVDLNIALSQLKL